MFECYLVLEWKHFFVEAMVWFVHYQRSMIYMYIKYVIPVAFLTYVCKKRWKVVRNISGLMHLEATMLLY